MTGDGPAGHGPLSLRALNRATLERQLLLRRAAMAAGQAVGHLAGLQAQAPLAPYVGLWTRLAGFRPQQLENLLTERAVVRAHLMRNTVHLLTAEDFVSFRPLLQPLMERGLAGNFGRNLAGVDLAELKALAAALLSQDALTRVELGRRLAPHWPGHDPASLAYAATHLLPVVQVPPRGLWRSGGQATFFLAAAWLAGLDASPPHPAVAGLDGLDASPPHPAVAGLDGLDASPPHPAVAGLAWTHPRLTRPSPGWTAWTHPRRIRLVPKTRGSSWCCGTWPPTVRPPCPTSKPGPGSPGCVR